MARTSHGSLPAERRCLAIPISLPGTMLAELDFCVSASGLTSRAEFTRRAYGLAARELVRQGIVAKEDVPELLSVPKLQIGGV